MAEPSEIFDPFLQRVVKCKLGDVVIFKYTGPVPLERVKAEVRPALAAIFKDIEFVIVGEDFDVAVFRPEPPAPMIHIA